MKQINHLIQPTSDTCVSTCLAMVLDAPVNQTISEFHEHYKNGIMTPASYLRTKRLACREHLVDDLVVDWGDIYITVVPSLNLAATLHTVVIDLRDEDNPIVIDPNKCKPGEKYYQHFFLNSNNEGPGHIIGSMCKSVSINSIVFDNFHGG